MGIGIATQHANDVGGSEHQHLAERVVEGETSLIGGDDRRVPGADEAEVQDTGSGDMPFFSTSKDEL